jgi:rhamnosyltransferase
VTTINSERPSIRNTGAAIVSYNPDPGFPDRLTRIANQVDGVLVVDNHSNGAAVGMLRRLRSSSGVTLVLNDHNAGVAGALNQALHWASQRRYRWLLTFDQDTLACGDLLETAAEVYDHFPNKDVIGLIGAQSYSDRRQRGEGSSEPWVEAKTVITSGTLMSLDACDAIGPFRDELFIDLVDLEYCLRARQKGFKVILSLTPSMHHQIGAMTTHRLPWKHTGTSNHTALRRYYMMRNHIVLAREYAFKDPGWVITSLHSRLKSIILICLFERDRLAKLRFTWLGLWDGLTSNLTRDLNAG